MDEECVRHAQPSRRELLKGVAALPVRALLTGCAISPVAAISKAQNALAARTLLPPEDDAFLEEVEKASCLYFLEQANPQTGMVRDRFNVRGSNGVAVASIAATGFGLTALCIAHKRGFVTLSEARGRVLTALRFLWRKLPNHRGFFYHFANMNTGKR